MRESITDREFLRNEAKNEAMKKESEPAATTWPPPGWFVAVDKDVKRNQVTIARAVSTTFARRIANALNRYTPDRRGQ
jgi:hypothetical protein